MGRIELTGKSLLYLLAGSTIAAYVIVLAYQVWALDSAADIAVVAVMAALLLVIVLGLWRWRTGRESEHLGTADDIAWDPSAYPWQAAKDRWQRSLRNLPGDDEDE